MVLAGAFPMVKVITKVAAKPFAKLGSKLGINEVAVAGLLACTANSVPCYAMIKDMDPKGKILNIAFSCCAAFGIGDHLGFCAGVEPELVFPMVAAKLLGGVLCIVAAIVFLKMDSSILKAE
jgi:ethanolamine transporter